MIRRVKALFFTLLVFFLFPGCVARLPGNSIVPEDARVIRGVPLYEDTGNQCGPSTLAAVMNYWGAKSPSLGEVSPEGIRGEIYSPGARGVLGMDMETYARKHGYLTRQYSGSIDDLKGHVLKDIPLIILVDYGMSVYQKNHFMVVAGFSGKGVIVHSGKDTKHIPFESLDAIWRKTNYWTLIIQPQD